MQQMCRGRGRRSSPRPFSLHCNKTGPRRARRRDQCNDRQDRDDRRHRRGPDGQRHRACVGAGRLQRAALRRRARADREGHRHRQRQHGPPGQLRQARRAGAPGSACRASRRPRTCRASPAPTWSSRRRPRTRAVKRKIFAQLCPLLNPEAILATNTSSISITRLAAQTDRPERFIGIHFMNPVPVMKLVELVRGIATEDPTFEAAKAYRQAARQDDHRLRGLSRPSSSTASCCR